MRIKCEECGHFLRIFSRTCPVCGARNRWPQRITLVVAVIEAAIVMVLILLLFTR